MTHVGILRRAAHLSLVTYVQYSNRQGCPIAVHAARGIRPFVISLAAMCVIARLLFKDP